MKKIVAIGLISLSVAGCTMTEQRAGAGAAIGGAAGAAIGAATTGRAGGALAGAAIGAGTGAIVGAATAAPGPGYCEARDAYGQRVWIRC